MSGSEPAVPAQADIVGIPGAAMTTLSLTQGLLRAVSADNVNPQAVIQMERLGSCFHSNGPWASRVPDLLCRASSVRIERLSAWIGWEKNDTASFMSKTTGGRTISLLCCVLGSLYEPGRYGVLLYQLSESILLSEQQIASPNQLGGVCRILEGKLACLGFGNHFAVQATRLRQCFFEAGLAVPRDLTETPTGEDMKIFLCSVRDVLQDENLVLQVTGTRCLATLLAVVIAICPDDTSVRVNGEILMAGLRDNIIFHVTGEYTSKTEFHIESRFQPQTMDFAKSYITQNNEERVNSELRFSFDNMLSDWLDLNLEMTDDSAKQSLKLAIANVVACTASSLTGEQLRGYCPSEGTPTFAGHLYSRFPDQGMRIALGPRYRQIISDRLQKVICRPTNTLRAFADEFETLTEAIHKAIPLERCTCHGCKYVQKYNSRDFSDGSCPLAKLREAAMEATFLALLCVFIKCGQNSTAVLNLQPRYTTDFLALLSLMSKRPALGVVSSWLRKKSGGIGVADGIEALSEFPSNIHGSIMDLFGKEQWSRTVCSSSGACTVYPSTLQSFRIAYPWTVYYEAVDGKLWFRSDVYVSIVTGDPRSFIVNRTPSLTYDDRRDITEEPITKGEVAAPSALGQHTSLSVTLRPTTKVGSQILQLRCVVTQSTQVFEVDFLNLHLGLMTLAAADPCDHALSKPLQLTSTVKATSVANPVARMRAIMRMRDPLVLGVTLTHLSEEAQFLCCMYGWRQLYQGDCCMPCAVAQAKKGKYQVIIGGSPRR
ncbi:hypothetical protein NXS19_012897 [Fusarium pseudograminearum]|nr:hypothetical protein NXS19_012897 [Fusarium pseudograminearum]